MQKCEKCETTFSFKIIFKSLWKGYKNFVCTNCQAQYKFNFKDRLIGGIIVGLATLISSLIMNYFELGILSKLTLGLFSMVVLAITVSVLSASLFSFELNKK